MVELKDGKGVEDWADNCEEKFELGCLKALTRVGKKVERSFELKEGKGVEHWVVSLAVKDVSWVV